MRLACRCGDGWSLSEFAYIGCQGLCDGLVNSGLENLGFEADAVPPYGEALAGNSKGSAPEID